MSERYKSKPPEIGKLINDHAMIGLIPSPSWAFTRGAINTTKRRLRTYLLWNVMGKPVNDAPMAGGSAPAVKNGVYDNAFVRRKRWNFQMYYFTLRHQSLTGFHPRYWRKWPVKRYTDAIRIVLCYRSYSRTQVIIATITGNKGYV